jgi:hypothetical protein
MSDWKHLLQQANRAVLVTITNNTTEPLTRGPHSVEYGTWSLFPPEKILPGAVAEFGTHSTKILTGTGGQVCYTLGSLDFKFFWENNYWSNMNYSSNAPNKLYQIETKGMQKISVRFSCIFFPVTLFIFIVVHHISFFRLFQRLFQQFILILIVHWIANNLKVKVNKNDQSKKISPREIEYETE